MNRRLAAIVLIASLARTNVAIAQWQLTDAPGKKLDTDQPIAISDGYALIGINNSKVGVYDIATGALIRHIDSPNGAPIETRTFAAGNGRLLISDSITAPNPVRGHSRAYAFDIATGRQLAELDLQSPTRRLELGGSVATDGTFGIMSSVKCVSECDTDDRMLRGVVDVFHLETGEHLVDIVYTNDSFFGQTLAIDQNVVAVFSRSRNSGEPGKVHLFDIDGNVKTTIVPDGDSKSHRDFGADLAMANGRLAVGAKVNESTQGSISVFDVASGDSIAEFSAEEIGLEGNAQFGNAVDVSGDFIIVGDPVDDANAQDLPESVGGIAIANVSTRGYVSLSDWTGGDSVAIFGDHALVRSVVQDRTSVYSISLVGLLPSIEVVSAATLQTLGDLDGDGNVDFEDFLALSSNYGSNVDGVGHGDLNSNGIVDFADFLILSENYGAELAAAAQPVPEPAFSWLAIVLGSALRRKGRQI